MVRKSVAEANECVGFAGLCGENRCVSGAGSEEQESVGVRIMKAVKMQKFLQKRAA